MNDIQLSGNFKLSELVKSDTAERLDIDNWPTDNDTIEALRVTANRILQPVRMNYGISFSPTSGFRCLTLNRALKSKDTSDHVLGRAVDFEVPGIPNKDLAVWIRDNLSFDQVILEFWDGINPNSGWVHCSFRSETENRNQCLTINKNGVFNGFRAN